MYWQDEEDATAVDAGGAVVDLAFRLRCVTLPVEHAWALSEALRAALPWFADEPMAGLHLIHVAESGNGWMRPEADGDALLHLSRRTRLTLRLPEARVESARALSGTTLDVGGFELGLGEATVKPLNALATVFARYVVSAADAGEEAFADAVAQALAAQEVAVRKLLPGRAHTLDTPAGPVHTRSVLLADLKPEESLRIQRHGIGPHRHMGCGLFIPHKGIDAVKPASSE